MDNWQEFENKSPNWKNEGEEPPQVRKTEGYAAGWTVPAGWLNWFWARVSKCLTELQGKVKDLWRGVQALETGETSAGKAKNSEKLGSKAADEYMTLAAYDVNKDGKVDKAAMADKAVNADYAANAGNANNATNANYAGNANRLNNQSASYYAIASAVPPKSHVSSVATYGAANSGNFGHVKLWDIPDAGLTSNTGHAATPLAVSNLSNSKLSLTGGTMTGALTVFNGSNMSVKATGQINSDSSLYTNGWLRANGNAGVGGAMSVGNTMGIDGVLTLKSPFDQHNYGSGWVSRNFVDSACHYHQTNSGGFRFTTINFTAWQSCQAAAFSVASSARYKKDIESIDTKEVKKGLLKAVVKKYHARNDLNLGKDKLKKEVDKTFVAEVKDETLHVGFIAEELFEVYPEAVGLNNKGKPESVDLYALISGVHIICQEQQKELDEQQKELDEQEKELDEQEKRIANLEAQIAILMKENEI